MKLGRRKSSAVLHNIHKSWFVRSNCFLVRSHRNHDSFDRDLPILTRPNASRRRANNAAPIRAARRSAKRPHIAGRIITDNPISWHLNTYLTRCPRHAVHWRHIRGLPISRGRVRGSAVESPRRGGSQSCRDVFLPSPRRLSGTGIFARRLDPGGGPIRDAKARQVGAH
jgi:hypothetical protein